MKLTLIVTVLASLSVQGGRAEPEIHLIPEDFSGVVTIAYRAKNGEPAAYEDGARLYRIPKNGILLTQADLNRGISPEWKFFFVKEDGTRTQIARVWGSPVNDTPEDRADTTIGVVGFRRARMGSGRVPCVEFDQYIVGTKAQVLALGSHTSAELGSVLRTQYECQ